VSATSPLLRDLPTCLYAATSVPPAPMPPLAMPTRAAVVVIGAGYTGLSTALHLASGGHDVVVLEAQEPGWGAAGRNGGQVNAGLKHEPDQILRDLGPAYGERLVQLAASGPDCVFELIARHRIACEAERGGTLRAAYTSAQVAALERVVAQWRPRSLELRMLDHEALVRLTGTRLYRAALHDPRGGAVNPLGYARGLAMAALDAGARIHGQSRVRALERTRGGWRVRTERAEVETQSVVIATDGYTDDLWPGLRTSVVPIFSAIVASAPLPADLAASVMPTRAVLYEVGSITAYYRRDASGRLLMGGRGVQRTAPRLIDYRHLVQHAERLWPALAAVRWTHWWNGQFALTPDFYPRLHAPAPGVYIALGYSGRGLALATAIGKELAAAASGTPLEQLSIPVTPIRPIALHGLWRAGVAARVAYGRVRDRLGI
jgi:glycine/D-amino acid oxidase-like deaminating enzyme